VSTSAVLRLRKKVGIASGIMSGPAKRPVLPVSNEVVDDQKPLAGAAATLRYLEYLQHLNSPAGLVVAGDAHVSNANAEFARTIAAHQPRG